MEIYLEQYRLNYTYEILLVYHFQDSIHYYKKSKVQYKKNKSKVYV